MSRVNIINVNFVELPKTGCLHPNTSFYDTWQGYTLGTIGGMLLIGCIWLAGQHVIGPRMLRNMSAEEKAHRLRRFQTVCLSRSLLVLYLIYPGVSGVVVSTFNCVKLPSGKSYLVADVRQQCWTRRHWAYAAGAFVWLLIIPIGIPLFFLFLLFYFRVPQMARVKVANAWLREAVEYAWSSGIPQPVVDVPNLGFDNISDEHLELLVAKLVVGEGNEEEAEEPAEKQKGQEEGAHSQPGCLRMRVRSCIPETPATTTTSRLTARRVILEKSLLLWCRTSGVLSLPPLCWAEEEEDEIESPEEEEEKEEKDAHESPKHEAGSSAEAEHQHQMHEHGSAQESRRLPKEPPADAKALRGVFSGFSTTSLATTPAVQVAALEQRALRKIAFLFQAYSACSLTALSADQPPSSHSSRPAHATGVECYYWEVVELGRKLLLTSILALVAPGSATQVTVGVLIAFTMLLIILRLRPYAREGMNFVAALAQVSLWFFLFVALLLKVRVNGDATDSRLFNSIVVILSTVPVALPILAKVGVNLSREDNEIGEDQTDEGKEGLESGGG